MRKDKLFYVLFKSYALHILLMGAVITVFLLMISDVYGRVIEVNLLQLLLLLILLALCSLIYILWSAKRITRPLEQLSAAIGRMSEGKYSERLNVAAGYEFSIIQQRFNEMAESLELAQAETRRLQESKQRMLADLSHDLKTPVTTIQGYAKALELGLNENEDKKSRYLQLIYNKATLVAALVDQIFQFAKLDRPDYPLTRQEVDLSELLREITAEYYEPFEEKDFQLEVDIPAEEVTAACDPLLMRRAVSNLLSNALKHNPPGTRVTVKLQESERELSLQVTDNGVGIPEEANSMVFEPFVRGDATRQEDGGSGLGLAIARQIAELHGGELRLHSKPGTTTFNLLLRRRPPSA